MKNATRGLNGTRICIGWKLDVADDDSYYVVSYAIYLISR